MFEINFTSVLSKIRKAATFMALGSVWIGFMFLAAQGIPLLFKHFTHHTNETTVGLWMVITGGVLALGTVLLILFKKN